MTNKITGKVLYKDLGVGAWGIRAADGTEWRPHNMPEQLKIEDATVQVSVVEIEEAASIHMWGKACKIVSFETPSL